VPLNLSITPNASVPFKVRYEDEDLLVVEKPPRIPSQPGKGHESDTLLNGLFALHGPLLQNLGRGRDFGLLHRLDMPTSGLLLVGLRPRAYDGLRAQFEKRTIRKFYWAVAARAPTRPSGVIRRPILEETGEKKTVSPPSPPTASFRLPRPPTPRSSSAAPSPAGCTRSASISNPSAARSSATTSTARPP
jgi:23S rRNA-/tRNA-specific pseudouridylate synthase